MSKQQQFLAEKTQLEENERLERELETVKSSGKSSEGIKALIEYTSKEKTEPFDKGNYPDFENAYHKATGGGGCTIL